ncbi:hypothetical protein Q1J55_04530 [Pseudomonas syringae]|uniref:hypothetical protein n=1 Tax=Pseudomonas syringae group TaxID=136849 RepID=UPI00073081F0|nr:MULTISPECIES: hypothetical protein [Pseudomonas syringae group]
MKISFVDMISLAQPAAPLMPNLECYLGTASDFSQEVLEHISVMVRKDLSGSLQLLEEVSGSTEHQQTLAERFSWLLDEYALLNSVDGTTSRIRMNAFLASCMAWSSCVDVWHGLIEWEPATEEFKKALAHEIRSRKVDFSIPEDTPVWEREMYERLIKADSEENWTDLLRDTGRFMVPKVDMAFAQAISGLVVIAPDVLARVVALTETWLGTVIILNQIKGTEAFFIAALSGTSRAIFTALASVDNVSLITDEAVAALLTKAADDLNVWSAILHAFNKYPVRYPWLQRGLGRVLALVSTEHLKRYVDTLGITHSPDCGEVITVCLETLQANASHEIRVMCWHFAYERWEQWQAGLTNDNPGLGRQTSIVDYAVIGWLVEGCHDKQLGEWLEQMSLELQRLQQRWFSSKGEFDIALDKLRLRYRLYHAALRGRHSGSWSAELSTEIPDAISSPYWQSRWGEN